MKNKRTKPKLTIVIPCFNEADVFSKSAAILRKELDRLMDAEMIDVQSRLLFVDDGSKDTTWSFIAKMAAKDEKVLGLRLSRNEGHQRALLAGLLEARAYSDITISLDIDLQDDLQCLSQMIAAYQAGNEIVYGVRKSRNSDRFAKKWSALIYYRLQHFFDPNAIPNHADFRLMSKTALEALSRFNERDLYLRGLIPMLGFPSTKVYYERLPRLAGKSKYTVRAMWNLAKNGFLGFTTKLLNWIFPLGLSLSLFIPLFWLFFYFEVPNPSLISHLFFFIAWICGLQLTAIGCLAIYIRRIYFEQKHRPLYHIMERTNYEASQT